MQRKVLVAEQRRITRKVFSLNLAITVDLRRFFNSGFISNLKNCLQRRKNESRFSQRDKVAFYFQKTVDLLLCQKILGGIANTRLQTKERDKWIQKVSGKNYKETEKS